MANRDLSAEPPLGDSGKTYSLSRDEAASFWIAGGLDAILATAEQTAGQFALLEATSRRGDGPPLHLHDREDEGYYTLEGEYTFFVGDETIAAPSGTWVFTPRRIPHTFVCESQEGRHLHLIIPAGFEAFFSEAGERATDLHAPPREAPPDVERLTALAARYDVTILGPPPTLPS